MDGLIVLQPHANQIINGQKKTEFRNKMPPEDKINTPLYLLSSGYALGKFKIAGFGRGKTNYRYGWRIKVIKKFSTPKKYKHLMGAQIWVKNVKLI